MSRKDLTVSVNGIGKQYTIKTNRRVDSMRDLLSNPIMSKKQDQNLKKREFWALKDISFDLHKGDTIGIIGRNGAGKSTLLKILAQVITPTEGEAIIKGRVASLLEVGTGFHPELTGKENVFFNGSLLGMSKSEVAAKYNKIVDFSEIGDFINTPIKRYSSGMKVRLAFSVAAHLDADITILDEALAVGDMAFKQKALEKTKASSFEGRTVMFVTHSMSQIQDLCNMGMYLKDGKTEYMGTVQEAVDRYLGQTRKDVGTSWNHKQLSKPVNPKDSVKPIKIQLKHAGRAMKYKEVPYGDEIEVDIEVEIDKPKTNMSVGISLFDDNDRRLFRSANVDTAAHEKKLELQPGKNHMSVNIPTSFLRPGLYSIALDADEGKDWVIHPNNTEARVGFVVKQPTEFELWNPQREAMLKPMLEWHKK